MIKYLAALTLLALSLTGAAQALVLHANTKFDNGGICDPVPGGGYKC